MAIGSDRRLGAAPRMNTTMGPPRAPSPTTAQPQKFSRAPQINDSAVSNMANNRLAEAAGSAQGAIREMDRAGVSRGKGQRYAADIAEASADADARGEVAAMEQGVAKSNALARQAYDNTRSNERLQMESLLESLRSGQASERLARQGWGQDLYETMRRGQFGLDGMQLDYSSLLARLFQ